MLDNIVLTPGTPEAGVETLNPTIRVIESDDTYGKVSVEPLPRGFGLTIGNPLRRILLSSTNGSAITWVKIEDMIHEYSAVPGVKEEVMEILLNVRRIRIRSQSDRAGKMRLDVKGEGRVCAGDISTSSDFEIVNPELHLATLDSDDAHLSMEFNVEQGLGYKTAGQSDGVSAPPVGVLPVDAVFSPVRKVNYNVERTRVGQVTDYERLVMEVWTDGTIKAVDAIQRAADKLVSHFFLFTKIDEDPDQATPKPLIYDVALIQMPIEKLELSPRTLNCLKRSHISKVGEVLEMSDDDLLKIRNFGEKSLDELKEKLIEHGITDTPGGSSGAVDDISPEDLGELMGDEETDPESPAGAPGMSIENVDEVTSGVEGDGSDEDDSDDNQDKDKD